MIEKTSNLKEVRERDLNHAKNSEVLSPVNWLTKL